MSIACPDYLYTRKTLTMSNENTVAKKAVIVDAFSTGRFLARAFAEKGIAAIHVRSSAKAPPLYSGNLIEDSDFLCELTADKHLTDLLAKLQTLNPDCVVAGSEGGVELTDILSERLGLNGNGTKLSSTRRNKYKMHEALKTKGIAYIRCCKSSQLNEITQWVKNQTTYPVVIKPLNSAASDGVSLCEDEEDLKSKFYSLIGSTNVMGLSVDEVLVQEFISGEQYVVNTVSMHGQHFVTDIWRSGRTSVNDAHFVYDVAELIPSDGLIQRSLTSYTSNVLDALGIKFGPAHSELFWTSKGPILIETGARLCGGYTPLTSRECIGFCEVDLTVDAYLRREEFLKKSSNPYVLAKHAYLVALISYQKGRLKGMSQLQEIRRLKSYFSDQLNIQVGQELLVTQDLSTSPGDIHLVHPDCEILRHDLGEIRRIESEGLYEL